LKEYPEIAPVIFTLGSVSVTLSFRMQTNLFLKINTIIGWEFAFLKYRSLMSAHRRPKRRKQTTISC
jgi:uncharacterized membrane protein